MHELAEDGEKALASILSLRYCFDRFPRILVDVYYRKDTNKDESH